jgi:proline iminopeptidase
MRNYPKPTAGFVEGGARIYYKTLGRGPALILLHGGPGADHSDFLPFLTPLARRFRLILMDERGSGRSERLEDSTLYTLEHMVHDIERLRKHLNIQRFALLGHSFGGILAQAYAVRHPRRLFGLILAGTASSADAINADFRKIRAALSPSQRSKLAGFEKRGIFRADGQYHPGYARLTSQALAPYMYARAPSTPGSPLSGMEVLREMWVRRSDFRIGGNLKGFDFTSDLKKVAVPSLVVIGDRDMVTTASADATRAALPHATLVVMADCGHMMFVDQTDRFNTMLTGFLTSLPAKGARRSRRAS